VTVHVTDEPGASVTDPDAAHEPPIAVAYPPGAAADTVYVPAASEYTVPAALPAFGLPDTSAVP
jgi:hypothetical protein